MSASPSTTPGAVTPTAVLLAKWPEPGRVKTRLARDGLGAARAAEVAAAMLDCTLERLRRQFPRTVVAIAPDDRVDETRARFPAAADVVAQGEGTLGDRMQRLWARPTVTSAPIAFFGVDCPDVPTSALRSIGAALERTEAALGPTADGGYWTLAARSPQPALLARIDWGTALVYDQTRSRAVDAGVSLTRLEAWSDVDDRDDLESLRRRLREQAPVDSHGGPARDADAPLRQLRERLDAILDRGPDRGLREIPSS